jgi:CRP-like cAMP-binding protein
MATTQPAGDRAAALARATLLRGMPAGEIARLARACQWRSYEPGAVVIAQDSPSRDVLFVAAGRVRVTIYASSGREVAFRDLAAGANFGEVTAIDGLTRSASVVALTRATLAQLSPERFARLLRTQPAVTDNVLRQLTGLVRSLTERVVDYSTLGVRSRIRAELVRMAHQAGTYSGRATIAPVPRHADIASRVSTNREAVARELAALARLGMVERRRDGLVLTDVARLATLVESVGAS